MTPWLHFKATVSGEQGPIMQIDSRLPLSLWADARALAQKADAIVRVHNMTLAGHPRKHIARVVGHSPTWVKDRQEELGLL